MANGIRLHPRYGVNPTMPICFWCQQPRGDIALLGNAYKGEAPRHMVIDYVPCADCEANMALGITIIQVTPNRKPTGSWVVMKEEAFNRMFTLEVKQRKCFMDVTLWKTLGLDKVKET